MICVRRLPHTYERNIAMRGESNGTPRGTVGGPRRGNPLRALGLRRRKPQELTGVGALVGVTELVRNESDLQTVLSLIARTVSETLGFGTVVFNSYRRAWDDFCVTAVHGDADGRA